MTVNMTFHLTWDPSKEGSLGEFRKKYETFRAHISRMQANGSLPVGEVRWSVTRVGPMPPRTPAQAKLVLVHKQGTPLEAVG